MWALAQNLGVRRQKTSLHPSRSLWLAKRSIIHHLQVLIGAIDLWSTYPAINFSAHNYEANIMHQETHAKMPYDNHYLYLRTLLLSFLNLDYMMLTLSLIHTTSICKSQLNLLYCLACYLLLYSFSYTYYSFYLLFHICYLLKDKSSLSILVLSFLCFISFLLFYLSEWHLKSRLCQIAKLSPAECNEEQR